LVHYILNQDENIITAVLSAVGSKAFCASIKLKKDTRRRQGVMPVKLQ
jgi:hypothetical protein